VIESLMRAVWMRPIDACRVWYPLGREVQVRVAIAAMSALLFSA